MANANIPNLPETDLEKEDWKMIWGFLAIVMLVMPVIMPVSVIVIQGLVWQYVLARIPQVNFSFGFLESCLFVLCMSLAIMILNLGFTHLLLLRSGKSLQEYAKEERLAQKAKLAELKKQNKLFDGATLRQSLTIASRQFALFAICLAIASHCLPGKLSFYTPGAFLTCAFVLTTIREMYWRIWNMILSCSTDAMKERFPQMAEAEHQDGPNN